MLAYLVRRIAWAGVLFLAITMVTFILFFVLPVSSAQFVRRTEFSSNDFKRSLAIDGPIYKQYGEFVGRIVRHGSLGASFDNRQDVNGIVVQAAPVVFDVARERERPVALGRLGLLAGIRARALPGSVGGGWRR